MIKRTFSQVQGLYPYGCTIPCRTSSIIGTYAVKSDIILFSYDIIDSYSTYVSFMNLKFDMFLVSLLTLFVSIYRLH